MGAAGTLKPLACTGVQSDIFCNLILDYNLRQNHTTFLSIKNNNSIIPDPPSPISMLIAFLVDFVVCLCTNIVMGRGARKTNIENTKVYLLV